jgi:hypothetical protein
MVVMMMMETARVFERWSLFAVAGEVEVFDVSEGRRQSYPWENKKDGVERGDDGGLWGRYRVLINM